MLYSSFVVIFAKTAIDDNDDAKNTDIPLRLKRTTDGGQMAPLPMTRQSTGYTPTSQSGHSTRDYQYGGATYDTSGGESNPQRSTSTGDDEIRTRMVFNTDNYDVIAETGGSTYTPRYRPNNRGSTSSNTYPQTNYGSRTRTQRTQYYVTPQGTAQRVGQHPVPDTDSRSQYNSGVQVENSHGSGTQTRPQRTRTYGSNQQGSTSEDDNQDHDSETGTGRGNYNTRLRTYLGQTPTSNTGTRTYRQHGQTTGTETQGGDSQTPVYSSGTPTQGERSRTYSSRTQTPYYTGTSTYQYNTGTTYRTDPGYSTLGQVYNFGRQDPQLGQNPLQNRRGYGGIGYTSSSIPNTGVVSNNPNCPTSGYRVIINGMQCSRAVDTLGSFICYNYERVSRECCEKCLSIKRASNRGCEYGDRSYQCRNMEPFDCYVPRNREICCETCDRYERHRNTGIGGCEYGDRTPRCQIVSERPHLCYLPENQRLCCQTCPRLQDQTRPSCRWGDQNPGLCEPFDIDGRLRVNCYQMSVREACCDTCERLRSRVRVNIPGCQYGDGPVQMTTPGGIVMTCREYVRQYGVGVCDTTSLGTHCCHTCYLYRSRRRRQ